MLKILAPSDRSHPFCDGVSRRNFLKIGGLGAAVLVGWTGQAWPDLLVAGVIALLFLHSAYDIIRDARRELAEHATRAQA